MGTAKKPVKEFVLPRLELKSMPAVEACIALLQKLKVSEIADVPDPDPTVFKLQQHYCRVGVQELQFFREVRDFFMLQGVGVNKDASDHFAAKFVATLLNRKRKYGSNAQVKKLVSQYIARCETALKASEKQKTDPENKALDGRRSVSESTVELGWFASHKERSATLPVESRAMFGRAASTSQRDRAPSDLGLERPNVLPLIED